MRIIGGKDYYDTALAFGHDPNVVYVRGKEEINVREAEALGLHSASLHGRLTGKNPRSFGRDRWIFGDTEYGMDFPTVIAAGKRYQSIRMSVSPWGRSTEYHYLWTREKFEKFLQEHELEFETKARFWPREEHVTLDQFFTIRDLQGSLLDLVMDRRWTILADDPGFFHAEQTEGPRFHAPYVWKIDQPVLRNMNFAQAVPPHLMFQEIDMWVSGRLPAAGREMIEISDEVRAAKHGMDKTSFRRPKSKAK